MPIRGLVLLAALATLGAAADAPAADAGGSKDVGRASDAAVAADASPSPGATSPSDAAPPSDAASPSDGASPSDAASSAAAKSVTEVVPPRPLPTPSVQPAPLPVEQGPPAGATRDESLVWFGVAGAVVLLLLVAGRFVGRRAPLEEEDDDEPEPAAEPVAAPAAVAEPMAAPAPVAEPVAAPEPEPEPVGEAAPEPPAEPPRRGRGWGLAKTRKEGFIARIGRLLKKRETVDQAFLDELEETLFKADIGVRTTESLLTLVRDQMQAGAGSEQLWELLRSRSLQLLDLPWRSPVIDAEGPYVILFVGVNGSGKTTTIGKLAGKHIAAGQSVMLAAGDTFRAAAGEQLEVWAERVGARIVRGKESADPSSVIFDAIDQAKAEGIDVVIADTAGRLHTKTPLMQELKKIHRVCGKARTGAPHEVLLVVDATNGQNAILQARDFHGAIEVSGIVLSKLDGTAKGGVILGVCDELAIPVRYVGVGEQVADLREFSAADFVDELFQQEPA